MCPGLPKGCLGEGSGRLIIPQHPVSVELRRLKSGEMQGRHMCVGDVEPAAGQGWRQYYHHLGCGKPAAAGGA